MTQVLCLSGSTFCGSIDKHYNRWKKVIDALGDDYAVQERFFRQYYNAFKPDLKDIVSVLSGVCELRAP